MKEHFAAQMHLEDNISRVEKEFKTGDVEKTVKKIIDVVKNELGGKIKDEEKESIMLSALEDVKVQNEIQESIRAEIGKILKERDLSRADKIVSEVLNDIDKNETKQANVELTGNPKMDAVFTAAEKLLESQPLSTNLKKLAKERLNSQNYRNDAKSGWTSQGSLDKRSVDDLAKGIIIDLMNIRNEKR